MTRSKAENLQARLRRSRSRYRSDREFAEAVGVKEPTMYKWLKGTPVWPDEPNLQIIANYYGCTIEDLGQPQGSSKERKNRLCEQNETRLAPTYDFVTSMIDKLPDSEKKRIIVYTAETLAV